MLTKTVIISTRPRKTKVVELTQVELLSDIARSNRIISKNVVFFFWFAMVSLFLSFWTVVIAVIMTF
jgi:hypothetical protein